MSERNTNNFYGFFPGGYMRQIIENAGVEFDKRRRLVKDLDNLIKEKRFDLKKFEDERDSFFYYMQMSNKLSNSPNRPPGWEKEAEDFAKMGAKKMQAIQEMVYPIFEGMLDLGYKAEELRG